MRPVASDLTIGRPAVVFGAAGRQRLRRAGIVHRAGERASLDHDVHDDLEVQRVQLFDERARIGEVARVPGELAVARVPAGRSELGTEIDERVARQTLVAELARDAEYLIGSRERA